MGKKIDGFVLSTAAAAALYLYFQHAFSSRWLAAVLALLSFIVLKRTFGMLANFFDRFGWTRRRRMRRAVSGTLADLALLPEEEAAARIEKLVRRCYDGEYAVAVLPGHPSIPLREERIFEVWKEHRGENELALCTLCRAGEEARYFSSQLKCPKTAIVDGEILSRLIVEHPEGFSFTKESSPASRIGPRLMQLRSLLFNRKNSPRNLMLAASMLALYLLTAKLSYLAVSMALLFLALSSLRVRPRPASIF